ncbi:MAG: VWA domain-containing protein [Bacteroidetes bacterium]|nr:VWA domain-containing protein [Bacteroidota bacterium]
MRFENPDLLQLLWVLLFQAILLWMYWRWRTRTLRRLGSPALEERLLMGFSAPRFWIKNSLFALSLALMVFALANPQQAVEVAPPLHASSDVIIGLDISNSMMAGDVSGSRLKQAKAFAIDLIKALDGERMGLLFFAGAAFPQTPLSTDYESMLMFVQAAQPNFITDQGTDLKSAIDLGARMFTREAGGGKAIILISDGENHEPGALETAEQAKTDSILLFTVSVGTATGAPVPADDGAFRKDFQGQTVRSAANAPFLTALAKAGGGEAFSLNDKSTAIKGIKTAIAQLQKTVVKEKTRTVYRTYYQWFVLPILLLLLFEQLLWWRKKRT